MSDQSERDPGEVRRLHTINTKAEWAKQVNESTIPVLEEALAEAKAGELTGVAVTATTKAGTTYTVISDNEDSPALMGGLMRLIHRINVVMDSKLK